MSMDTQDAVRAQYSTTDIAYKQCDKLRERIGVRYKYLVARMAIARSLSQPNSPLLIEKSMKNKGKPINGQNLFGKSENLLAWIALIVQHNDESEISIQMFQELVAAHWQRGANLLINDWNEAGEDLDRFVKRLADHAKLPIKTFTKAGEVNHPEEFRNSIVLPIGTVSKDVETGEKVNFQVNAPGGSPHLAIMGGTNSGKTGTAMIMLEKLREFGDVPILAFDFKGDLSNNLAQKIQAEVCEPSQNSIPLDVLAVDQRNEKSLLDSAGSIRDSIAKVKSTKISGVQSEALHNAILKVIRHRDEQSSPTISEVASALAGEYKKLNRRGDELTATLNELAKYNLFNPQLEPKDFFARSWIIRIKQQSTMELKRFVVNLTLDALDRWINSMPDSSSFDGWQSLRHVTMLDEAHLILKTKLPALSNLIRMSRSKGGVIMLVSQSPNDFEGQDEGYLDNMGLTLAFATQALPGSTRRIFNTNTLLTDLEPGEALCRIKSETKTRRMTVWQPSS